MFDFVEQINNRPTPMGGSTAGGGGNKTSAKGNDANTYKKAA
jgi:hypothetical protein